MYSSNIESIMKNTFVIIVSIMALSCYKNKKNKYNYSIAEFYILDDSIRWGIR